MSDAIHTVLQRHHQEILQELRRAFHIRNALIEETANEETLLRIYGQMQYHLGWLDQHFQPAQSHPGKLLRPKLLLLSYELACTLGTETDTSSLRPALPAAAAVELAHNFTLLHDDIQDGDIERRHRPTVWYIWGIPQAILVGDALFMLARLHLWKILDEGVEPATALYLARLFDTALLKLTEGQHLDMAFERQQQVSIANYEEMISRKTATLMRYAVEMGATLGTHRQETIAHLAHFGHALGIAFQVRDDIQGAWATEAESGKQPSGDIYRRKKSLPIVHALQHAQQEDRQTMTHIYYQDEPVTQAQVQEILAIFERTGTREYCQQFLYKQCQQARSALAQIAMKQNVHASSACTGLWAIIDFIERN